jgi:hypothetical protein
MPTPSRAGLGETLDQSIQRYGAVLARTQMSHLPVNEATMRYDFSKNGFNVQVAFVGGKAAWMIYSKEDKSAIFETEIKTILDNNAEGSTWSAGTSKPDRFAKKIITFERADHLADAKYEEVMTYHGLIIISKAWRHATSQASDL